MTNNQQGHSRQYSAGERYRQGRERGRAVKHLVDIPLDRPQFIDPAFFSESGASISAVIALTEGDAILQEPQFFHPLSEDLSGDYSIPRTFFRYLFAACFGTFSPKEQSHFRCTT